MRYLLILFMSLFLVIAYSAVLKTSEADHADASSLSVALVASTEAARVYPIAPGVWYPGEPLPEKPMRYYRVRCWPGCHRGSSHGMYPDKPLNMKPIFPTQTIDLSPTLSEDAE